MGEKFSNNATSTLAAGISNSDTSLSVQSGHGARWPTLAVGDWCWSTLTDGTNIEIVMVVARSSDTFTIIRGLQGTSAQSWSSGATFQMRLTRQTLESFRDGSQRLVLATGWDVGNYLQSAAGVLNGDVDMTISVMARLGRAEDEDGSTKTLLTNGNVFVEGYNIKFDSLRPYVSADHGGKLSTGSFEPNWSGHLGSPQTWGFVDYKTVMITLHLDSGVMSVFVNQTRFRSIDISASGTYAPGSNGMRVGLERDDTLPFARGGIAGIAYVETALDQDDLRDWVNDCMQACDVIDGGMGWSNLYSFKQMLLRHGDSVPATVEDLVGSADLTRTGTLSIVEEIPRWL